MIHTWCHEEFTISTDRGRLNVTTVHDYLSRDSYWAQGRSRELVERSIAGSLCFGLYDGEAQIGFARVITDGAVYAYLADVFVLEPYRGRGLAKWMISCVIDHPQLRSIRRFMLATQDAHGLYEKFGWSSLSEPSRHMERLHLTD